MHLACPFPHHRPIRPRRSLRRARRARVARLRRIEHDRDDEQDRSPSRSHLADLTRHRAEAAAFLRAFETLAALHRQGWVPAPLFGVRTRRHVLTILQNEALGGDDLYPVRSALCFTLGLPMPRTHGFRLMREAFDTLGLLALLPDRAGRLLPSGGDGCDVPTAEPVTFEAWTTAVDGGYRETMDTACAITSTPSSSTTRSSAASLRPKRSASLPAGSSAARSMTRARPRGRPKRAGDGRDPAGSVGILRSDKAAEPP